MFNNTNEETIKKNDADFDIIHAQGIFKDFNGEELAAFTTVFKESAWQEWSETIRQNKNHLAKVLAGNIQSMMEKVSTSVKSLSNVNVQFQTNSITVVEYSNCTWIKK